MCHRFRWVIRLGTAAILSIACASAFVALSLHLPRQFSRTSTLTLGTSLPIAYFVDDGSKAPGFQHGDVELAKWALDAWSRESGGKLKFAAAANRDAALIQLHWVSANEGLFGETQRVLVQGKVGAAVFVMPEISQLGEPLSTRASTDSLLRDTIVYLTCVHELGHAIGLEHTQNFDDIMYSFAYGGDIVQYFMRYRSRLKTRADIAQFSGLSDGDRRTLHTLYR